MLYPGHNPLHARSLSAFAGTGEAVPGGSGHGPSTLVPGRVFIDGRVLGWAVGEVDGQHYLEHKGSGPGFATTMRIYPDEGLGVAILSNGTELDRTGFADLLGSMDW